MVYILIVFTARPGPPGERPTPFGAPSHWFHPIKPGNLRFKHNRTYATQKKWPKDKESVLHLLEERSLRSLFLERSNSGLHRFKHGDGFQETGHLQRFVNWRRRSGHFKMGCL